MSRERKHLITLGVVASVIMLIFLLVPLGLHAQVQNNNLPDCVRGFQFIVTANTITAIKDDTGQALSAGASRSYDNRAGASPSVGCNLWHLSYSVSSSSLSAISIEVDFANDSNGQPGSFSVWTASNVVGTLPMTSVTGLSKVVSMYGQPDWVRVFLNSATGTGTVSGQLIGWRPQGTSDSTTGASPVNPATFQFKNITANASTQVKTGSGSLHSITVNLTAAGTITLFDNSSCAGTKIGTVTLFASATPGPIPVMLYDVTFNTGLCIITSASPDLTIAFK